MTPLKVFVARLKGMIGRNRSDRSLDDDIQAHLDLLADDYRRQGLSGEEARAAARRAFGGIDQMKEAYRDQRGLPFLDTLLQDTAIAVRMLRRSPSFAAVAICSLAFGIGASTAAFSLFNAVMLRPLSVPDPAGLVLVQPLKGGSQYLLFNPLFEALRERQHTLTGMFAASDDPFLKVTFDDAEVPTYVRGSLVSGEYFSVLGLSASLGRLLVRSDDEQSGTGGIGGTGGGGPCAAVISDNFWRRRFDQRADIVGRSFRVRESVCTIVGVAPAGFSGHESNYRPDVWLPLRPLTDRRLLESRGMSFFSGVMGRLAPGTSVSQAETELTSLYQQAIADQPVTSGNSAPVRPADFTIRLPSGAQGLDNIQRLLRIPLAIALGVVGVVLLIAAVNVANLLLARGIARRPELATRAALGASRARLVRQLATEGTVIAALGGAVGAGLASWAAPALGSIVSSSSVNVLDTHVDQRVVVAAIAATALAALLAGVLPAFRLTRMPLSAGMAGEGRTTVSGGQPLTRVLVGAQFALSLLLVTTAALLLQTMVHLAGSELGFQPEHVVMLEVHDESPGPGFGVAEGADRKSRRAGFYRTLDERLNAIRGVRAASVSWLGLFSPNDLSLRVSDADQPTDRAETRIDYVSPRYFETVGMQVQQGRGISPRDREGDPRVAVINESMARSRFNGNGLGRRLTLDYPAERERPCTVVRVVRDAEYNNLRETKTVPMMWVPIAQAPFPITSVALRTEPGIEAAVLRDAEAVLKAANVDVMVRRTSTLSAEVDHSTARERLLVRVSTGFAVIALLLAAIGLYGTLAYAVRRRTREIGVRMAFGAGRGAVLRMVLADALKLVAIGLLVGAPLAIGVGYVLRPILFGVTPIDSATFAGGCAVLTLVALLAAYLPARRAASVNPIVALRCE